MSAFRTYFFSLLALMAMATCALGAPVSGVTARYADGVIAVTATIDAPPKASGCRASVTTWWERSTTVRTSAERRSAAGLVTKTGADGSIAADTCQDLKGDSMWTSGRLSMQFRPRSLGAGSYRVCVRADVVMVDGRHVPHRSCSGFTVAGQVTEAAR